MRLKRIIILCAICGVKTKEVNHIYDTNYVTPPRTNVCRECLRDFLRYDDKALVTKMVKKMKEEKK